MWYIKYFWVKLNIWVLTPLVWIENKYNAYKELRLQTYVQYQIMSDGLNKIKQNEKRSV